MFKKLNSQVRITLGLVSFATTLLMVAQWFDITPNVEKRAVSLRRQLVLTLADAATAFYARGDAEGFAVLLEATVSKDNAELLSAGLRSAQGEMLIQAGQHDQWRTDMPADGSQFRVPMHSSNSTKWGDLEFRFTPVRYAGWRGIFWNNWTPTYIFLGLGLFAAYYAYLRRMLKSLDPSQAVPSRVKQALDTLTEGLLVLDRQGRIALANHSFSEFVGQTPESLVGKDAEKLEWMIEGETPWTPPWLLAIKEERPQINAQARIRDTHGHVRSFMVNCSPVLGAGGKYRGVLASFDDITLLEKNKAELRSARDAAESANRAKSEFLANMSHEIRTPMNAILGFTDVLRRGLAETLAEQQQYLGTIHASGKHLLELINDILDLSKVESGHFQIETIEMQPHNSILDVLTVLKVRADEKVLRLDYTSDGPIPRTINSDPTRLRQIITNLVGNALKFTEQGGVTVNTRFDAQDGMLHIHIRDTGIGMPSHALANIFEPFVQADSSVTRKFGGTGLGLSISRKFARAMGGDITVASQSGSGSTFMIRIPTGPVALHNLLTAEQAVEEYRALHQQKSAGPVVMRLKPARILVVDDGDANRQLISLVLKRAGVSVTQAIHGQDALDKVASSDLPFDVIFMDMQMPVLDGYAATAALRKQGYTSPIIALTGNAMKGDEEKCRSAGCSDFLTKPVDIDLLLEKVGALVGTRRPLGDSSIEMPVFTSAAPHESTTAIPSPASQNSETAGARAAIIDSVAKPSSVDAVINLAMKSPHLEPSDSSNKELRRRSTERRGVPPHSPSAAAKPVSESSGLIVSTLPMDDDEFRDIVSQFVGRLADQLLAMMNAWEQGDYEELGQLGHWLKGAGGTVGFPAFTEPSRLLENGAKAKNDAHIEICLREISDIARRIHIPPKPSRIGILGERPA